MDHLRPSRWRIQEVGETASTQDVASGLAAEGAPEGTVVAARTQTAGRGRSGRPWASPPGGVYISAVLRPGQVQRPQLISLVGALAVVRGIRKSSGLESAIRWPNDILIRGKKVAGVVVDASYSAETLSFAVMGIGLNCNSSPSSLGVQSGQATSLTDELNRPVDEVGVRQCLLEELATTYTSWLDGADIVDESRPVLGTLGRQVLVRSRSGVELSCTAVELDDLGGLVVVNEDERIALHAEDVELLTEVR